MNIDFFISHAQNPHSLLSLPEPIARVKRYSLVLKV